MPFLDIAVIEEGHLCLSFPGLKSLPGVVAIPSQSGAINGAGVASIPRDLIPGMFVHA